MTPRSPMLLLTSILLAAFAPGCHQTVTTSQPASQSIIIDARCLSEWPAESLTGPGFILRVTGYETDLDAVWQSAQWFTSSEPVSKTPPETLPASSAMETTRLKRLQSLGVPDCFAVYSGVRISTPLIPYEPPPVPHAPAYYFLRMPGQRTGTAGVLFPILLRGSGPLPEELFFVHDLQELHQLVSLNDFFLADPCIEGVPDRVLDSNGLTCWPPDIASVIKTIAARNPTPLIAPSSTPPAFPSLSQPR